MTCWKGNKQEYLGEKVMGKARDCVGMEEGRGLPELSHLHPQSACV